jgi:hypothetical protein
VFSNQCARGTCCARFDADLAGPFPGDLGFVSLYTRTDGIVDWCACLDPAALTVAVTGTGRLPAGAAYVRCATVDLNAEGREFEPRPPLYALWLLPLPKPGTPRASGKARRGPRRKPARGTPPTAADAPPPATRCARPPGSLRSTPVARPRPCSKSICVSFLGMPVQFGHARTDRRTPPGPAVGLSGRGGERLVRLGACGCGSTSERMSGPLLGR